MWFASFSTSTPKPRAEGSSPSAPATETAPKIGFKPLFLGAFSVFLAGVTRSGFPLLMLNLGRYFRIWQHLFLLFPFGTSSKEHQNFGWHSSQVEIIGDPIQPCGVFLDVVHFRNL